jgi:cytoskeletal protein RodZ
MQPTLGQRLQAARVARGLSLADAAHETRVPAARLNHLETDNYAAFGSMTYARSFLKLYADYLAVDASEMLDDLPSAVFAGPGDYRYLTDSFGPWVKERGKGLDRLSDPVVHGVQRIKSPLPAALAVFICVLAATGMFGKYVADSQRTLTEQQTRETIPSATATPLQTAAESTVPFEEQVHAAIPVDPLTLVPKQRTYPVLQPGDGL